MACGGSHCLSIRCWYASLYISSSHKWIYGHLNLSPEAVFFQSTKAESTKEDDKALNVYISFSDITSINKAQSSLIFPAITITTNNGETQWLSSLQDRNATFLTIQHFFQASLHRKPETSATTDLKSAYNTSQQRTKLGTELLRSVNDSQATLQKAAGNLVEQGEKLRGAAYTMEEIHEDLDVVERIAGGLNSWMGRWTMPSSYKADELIFVRNNEIPDVLDLEALCNQVTSTKIGSPALCVFRISKDGISILDMKQKVVQHFKWSDVSRIRVVSPWEILVTRFLIGQPDLSYDITCIAMPKALRMLEVFSARKMEYMNPPEARLQHNFESSSETPMRATSQTDAVSGMPVPCPTDDMPSLEDPSESQQQLVAQKEIITDAEVSELSATLSGLKSLALGIQEEQDSQLETIDRLTSSVTRGNDRLKNTNSKINRLLK